MTASDDIIRQLRPFIPDPVASNAGDRFTETGNARRLLTEHGHRFRWVAGWDTWVVYDGTRWCPDEKGLIVEAAKERAAALVDQAAQLPSDERKTMRAWAHKSESAANIRATLFLARSTPGTAIKVDELDTDPWMLNALNGTIDLRTGQLHAHDPERMLTKLAPVVYDPAAAAPRWSMFLEQILPDPDVRAFMARFAGYCLTGDITEHKVVIAHGVGRNGKGTLLNSLSRVMGDYAGTSAPDLLLRRRDEPHPTGLAALQGKRLVLASETGDGRRIDEPLLKRLTGGDRITARRMHKDFYEFDPTHKFVVATNHRPTVAGTDDGIWRRLLLVPFSVSIAEDERDLHLEDKLVASEAPGILRWAIEGCLAWQAGGLAEPAVVLAATSSYRDEMDLLSDFLTDCCHVAGGLKVRASNLLTAYNCWAEASGEDQLTAKRLGRALAERGFEKSRSNGIWWSGVGVRNGTMEPSGTAF